MSNNKVRDWAEIDKLAALEQLKVLHSATATLHAVERYRCKICSCSGSVDT